MNNEKITAFLTCPVCQKAKILPKLRNIYQMEVHG